jgi:hypothetical protein
MRTKGAVGNRSLTVGNLCHKLGFNIPEVVIGLTQNKITVIDKTTGEPVECSPDPEFILRACAVLMPYVFPKLSNVEIKAEIDFTKPLVLINGPKK